MAGSQTNVPLLTLGADGTSAPTTTPNTRGSQDSLSREQSPGFNRLLFANEAGSRGISHTSLRWWTPEILWLLVGYGSIAAIAAVLCHANGKPPPKWPLGVSLNSLLALLTSLSKVAFMLPIMECLGQLKWTWFLSARPKPIHDFQLFDEASRGPYGSFKLLFRFRGLANIGAVLILSAFLTSTFTQLAIDYQEVLSHSNNGSATLGRLTWLTSNNGTAMVVEPNAHLRYKRAISNGAFVNANDTVPFDSPNCSSGDCTWPEYGSLGLCSEVANLTAHGNETLLEELRLATSASLRLFYYAKSMELGYSEAGAPATIRPGMPLIILPVPHPSGALNESSTDLLLSDSFIAYSGSPLTLENNTDVSSLEFLEVAFYMCAKSFRTEVKDGIHSTTEISTHTTILSKSNLGLNSEWVDWSTVCLPDIPCSGDPVKQAKDETTLESPIPGEEPYRINAPTALIGSYLLQQNMVDTLLVDVSGNAMYIDFAGLGGLGIAFGRALYGEYGYLRNPPPHTQMLNVRGVARNMARSMTNLGREYDFGRTMKGPKDIVNGTVLLRQTTVMIRWGWLSVLAAQLFLSSIFAAAVIARTHWSGIQILKTSSLASICALNKATRANLGGINDLDSMQRRSKSLKVRLERGSTGVGLWLASEGARTSWQPTPYWEF